tara:strand:- start:92 stop:454 length:363 start_codon:yes stop_codon:yes gene_type:complete
MTNEEREAKQARLKKLFPNKRDRLYFDDIYCNRGGNVRITEPVRDLVSRMPTRYIHNIDMDTLIDAMFHKMFNGDISHENWEKLMKHLKPLYKEHKKNWAENDCEIPEDYFDKRRKHDSE